MNSNVLLSLQDEVEPILSHNPLDVDALDAVYTRICGECAPHEDAIAKIQTQLDSEELSEFKTNLLWAGLRRHEAEYAPLKVLRERIEEKASTLYEEAERGAKVAETAARYSVRSKAEAEQSKILDDVCKLGGNIVHGLSANSAWQTRRSYQPVKDLLDTLQKETDTDKALAIATEMMEVLKPRLLAKFSAHADIREELLTAFIAELKK